MARRRNDEPEDREPKSAPFHAPFRGLGAKLSSRPLPSGGVAPSRTSPRTEVDHARSARARAAKGARVSNGTPVRARVSPSSEVDREDEAASFARAMADVRRLEVEGRVDAPPPALGARRAAGSDEAEALAALSDLVAGTGDFDVSDSVEYVEGAVVGLDPRILRRLRRGEFAYQAYLDLHGMGAAAARVAVERFITDAFAAGRRAVLLVHGRGLNSKDNVPVLKERLKSWLARGRVGRVVLAFSSARPADGGAGALYVLLRRRRGVREPIAVFEGAKRE
jgi:DNA-nicking Smr family endonuclease